MYSFMLALPALFALPVHFSPYYYCSGFSHYWYEHQPEQRGLQIEKFTPNDDWFAYYQQELMRRRNGDRSWPSAYVLGWHCVGVKT